MTAVSTPSSQVVRLPSREPGPSDNELSATMVKAAAENEWIDGRRVTIEILTAIKRAGADMIISYHAKELARWLADER